MRMKNKRTLLWTNCRQKGSCLFYRDAGIKYYSCVSFSSASARLESRISTSTSPPFKALNTAFALDTPDTREILRSNFFELLHADRYHAFFKCSITFLSVMIKEAKGNISGNIFLFQHLQILCEHKIRRCKNGFFFSSFMIREASLLLIRASVRR